MKRPFTRNSFFIVFALACVASLATYWQSTTSAIVMPTVTTPQTLVAKETVAKDLALNEAPTPKAGAVSPLSKAPKADHLLMASHEVEKSEMDSEDAEEAREAAKRKNVGDRLKAEFDMIKDPQTGRIPKGIHQKELAAALKARPLVLPTEATEGGIALRTLPTIDVIGRGPNNYGGRTRTIGFDKRNTQIVLAGGVSSGIFRSTNGGTSWTRVTPSGQIHNVTAIAQDPRAGQENTWYYGTGEGTIGTGSNSANGTEESIYYGHGMWKSTDNGLTWTALPSTQGNLYSADNIFDHVSRIVVHPTTGHVLVAAGETIQRSANGGTDWNRVVGTASITQSPSDLIYNAIGDVYYAAILGDAADGQGGIYQSTNGATWTKIRTPTDLIAGGVKRIVLANVAATANILAFYETTNNVACGASKAGLQLYDATAMTWTDHTAKIGICASGSSNPKVIAFQGGYNMCITTKPDDANIVYLGGTEIYRLKLSDGTYDYIGGDQGAANATNLHVDNHLLVFEPGSNTKMWACNDGGMRHTDVTGTIASGITGGYSWIDRNTGYITYQYYRADINPATGSNFLSGAAQDNGITVQPTDATAKEITGGDGTCVGIISGTDFSTYNIIASNEMGKIYRLSSSGAESDIKPVGQAQEFSTFFLLDADNTNYLYYPTNTKKLYRTRTAPTISATSITGDAATGWEEITGAATTLSGSISTMATSRNTNFSDVAYSASNTARKMYIGTADGKVYRLADPAFCAVASTPINITPAGSSGHVSDIAVNPYDDKEIMVTYSNYNTPSVWHTTDASVATPTWTNVEGAAGSAVELASARAALIVRAGATNLYVVGTSTGLYGTMTLSGATTVWERISTNDIALSPSTALRLRASDNKAVLGTHGNGMYMLGFPPPVVPLDLLSFEAKKANNHAQINWITANELNVSHFNIQKSTDGKNFYFLTKIKATNAGTYQTADTKPNNGINYYRLEMVDLDGTRKVSKTVSVEFSTGKSAIKVYPTTTTGDLTIDNGIETIEHIAVYNPSGQLVFTANGTNRINITHLPSGLYLIQVQSGSEKVMEKVFKQ